MRRLFKVTWCLAVALAATAQAEAVTVTLIATSGYVFRGQQVVVAMDAFTSYGTSEEQRALMALGSPPYDVDVILVSHSHFDHFDGSLVADNMRVNECAILVGPRDVIEDVRSRMSGAPESRFLTVAPTAAWPVTQTVSGLPLTALSFPHPPDGLPLNVGFLFRLDSAVFFHPGDLDVDRAGDLFEDYDLSSREIDVAMLPSFMFGDSGLHEAIRSLGAGCLIPTHARPSELMPHCLIGSRFFDNLWCFGAMMEEAEFSADASCASSD